MATEIISPAIEIISPHPDEQYYDNVPIPEGFTLIEYFFHNPQLIALAIWAINEHNKDVDRPLRLSRVMWAAEQVLPNKITYLIIFDAMPVDAIRPRMFYKIKVLESGSCKKLLEFETLGEGS